MSVAAVSVVGVAGGAVGEENNGVTATFDREEDVSGFYTGPVAIDFAGVHPDDVCDPASVTYSGGPQDPDVTVSSTCTSAADGTTYTGEFSFTYDDEPPVVTVPDGITEEATSFEGAVVVFDDQVTAVGGPDPTCDPKDSGDMFEIGTTTLICSTTDAAGHSNSETFEVTVRDTTEPEFGPAPNVTKEGNVLGGYQGEAYTLPTATDAVDGGVTPDCKPGPGAKFDLGDTKVTCTASDGRGNNSEKEFTVTVEDKTRPVFLVPPRDVTVQAKNANTGTPATNSCIQRFLNTPTAHDEVGGSRPVTHGDVPAQFPVGDTTVTFTTSDGQGNERQAEAAVSVRIGPQGECTVDARAPRNVRNATVREGNRLVVLRWQNPGMSDFWRVEIQRSRTDGQGATRTFRTRREVLRDDEVWNGIEYRYVIYSVDFAGNRPNGVERRATPHRILLLRPRDGAVISRPPLFDWVRKARARYYNLQLHRMVNGELRKVLSRWPSASSYRLTRTWRFKGHRYRLVRGRYYWYVWPGFGPRSAANYGELMGANSFRVRRR